MKNIIDIQVIFKGSIKPSAPTPDHLRHYQLSFLDQLKPPNLVPIILFYSQEEAAGQRNHNNLSKQGRSDTVKKSLAEALTHFYPLAGRVVSKRFVDCNDEGAYYVEAEAKCQLSDILENPNPHDMNEFLRLDQYDLTGLALVVQVTFFNCGGMAIGVGMHHEIADGLSFIMFLKAWSALARGKTDFEAPIFGAASLFPPKEMSNFPRHFRKVRDEKIVWKRLVFDASKIAALVNKYSAGDNNNHHRPTRFEAVSAFIWNRFAVATCAGRPNKESQGQVYKFRSPVNIRTRMEPKLPDSYFGNINVGTIAPLPSFETSVDAGYCTVSTIKDAMKQINPEFVKKLQQQSDWYMDLLKQQYAQIHNGEMSFFQFASICRFPIYEVDFGWGNPAYAAVIGYEYKNKVLFLDTKSGDGIEAWLNLAEEDMAKFEADQEVLALFPTARL